jgi:hypothetical protein
MMSLPKQKPTLTEHEARRLFRCCVWISFLPLLGLAAVLGSATLESSLPPAAVKPISFIALAAILGGDLWFCRILGHLASGLGQSGPTLEPWSMGRLQVPGLRCVVVGLAKDEGHSEEGLYAGTDSVLPFLGTASCVAVRRYFSVQSLCPFPLSPTAALDELDWPQWVDSELSSRQLAVVSVCIASTSFGKRCRLKTGSKCDW